MAYQDTVVAKFGSVPSSEFPGLFAILFLFIYSRRVHFFWRFWPADLLILLLVRTEMRNNGSNGEDASTDLEIYATGSRFDVEVLEEASYILWYVWRKRHSRYSTLHACIDALVEDPGLYGALKKAHGLRDYGVIRHWGKCRALSDELFLKLASRPPSRNIDTREPQD